MITLKKSDIGGEIISILTKGMYSDPKDALREYVQNSVDAKAKYIEIKIRQNNIVVQDDGEGMDYDVMRNAIRLGVSDKNPKNQVGFMGIGIYSAFHICEKLIILSKVKNGTPNKIEFDFRSMREELEKQREARFNKVIKEEELVALQKLLENNIELSNLNDDEYSRIGTRVELIGLEPDFFKSLAKYDELSEYLERVLPLPFNSKFRWGSEIEQRIKDECDKHNLHFDKVSVKLQVNEQSGELFKPYSDEDFEPEPLKPYFLELKNSSDFFGIAWGCLNKDRATIKNEKCRGFLVKKQGFTIGKKEDLLEFFNRHVLFNRYVGEVVILNAKLLPNASRSAFEPSPLRISYYQALQKIATGFNEYANDYQETTKATEILDQANEFIKIKNAQLNFYIEDSETLLKILFDLKDIDKDLTKRYKNGRLTERKSDYDIVKKGIETLANEIRVLINAKKSRKKLSKFKTENEIAAGNATLLSTNPPTKEEEYKSFLNVLDSIGIEIDDDIKKIIRLIDEQYIQPSKSKNEYLSKLHKLKQDIEELLED